MSDFGRCAGCGKVIYYGFLSADRWTWKGAEGENYCTPYCRKQHMDPDKYRDLMAAERKKRNAIQVYADLEAGETGTADAAEMKTAEEAAAETEDMTEQRKVYDPKAEKEVKPKSETTAKPKEQKESGRGRGRPRTRPPKEAKPRKLTKAEQIILAGGVVCSWCHSRPAKEGRKMCEICAEKNRTKVKKFTEARSQQGLCHKCGKPAEINEKTGKPAWLCSDCKKYQAQHWRKKRKKGEEDQNGDG